MNVNADMTLIAAMAETLAPYRDDEETYLDTLDGETNVLDLVDREIIAAQSDESLAEAIKAHIADLRARQSRIEMRADAHRANIRLLLQHIALPKLERPMATVSVRPGNVSVKIINEAEIPSQLMRETVSRAPDKAAIKAHLDAGESVPGAELTRGNDILTMRTK